MPLPLFLSPSVSPFSSMLPSLPSLQVMDEVQPVMRPPKHSAMQVWGGACAEVYVVPNKTDKLCSSPHLSPLLLQTIFRARFSSVTESAIVKAFNTLVSPNWNEASSVDARMELDLRIGCSFTRFQTMTFQVSLCEDERE